MTLLTLSFKDFRGVLCFKRGHLQRQKANKNLILNLGRSQRPKANKIQQIYRAIQQCPEITLVFLLNDIITIYNLHRGAKSFITLTTTARQVHGQSGDQCDQI